MRICKICQGQVRIIPTKKKYVDIYNKLVIYGIGFGMVCLPCALKFKQNINNFQDDIAKDVNERLNNLRKQLGITKKEADKVVKETLKKKKKMKIVKNIADKMRISEADYNNALEKLK